MESNHFNFSSVDSSIEEIICPDINFTPITMSAKSSSQLEVAGLKDRVVELESSLVEKQNEILFLEEEIRGLRIKMAKRDSELMKQDRELNKLRSVLQQASSLMTPGNDTLLTTIQEHYTLGGGQLALTKKQGVSGQSLDPAKSVKLQKIEKDFKSKQLIRDAVMENDFLKYLSSSQVREIVDYMEKKSIPAGTHVIREGEIGSHLYVSADGDYEVTKGGKFLGRFEAGKAFGELAVLYNCKRTASIKALANGEVWMLERQVFQQIMMATGLQKLEDQIKFLRSVPLCSTLPDEILVRLSDALEVNVFNRGEYILRQGSSGDTFYIISEGQVRVTKKVEDNGEEEEIRFLSRGDYFGEQALLKTDFRTANIVANTKTVECLVLDRESFFQLVGDLSELREKDYADLKLTRLQQQAKLQEIAEKKISKEFADLTLMDLEVITTLGIGGFGRVELVQISKEKGKTYALKCLKKKHIVDTQQQEHVFSEKRIMMNCKHQFIARLFRTFKDRKFVYLLMECCLGGELWSILRDKGHFDDSTTRFYTACVVSALDYLHGQGIIYRDLKPENLLLDAKGYVKMVDFGFSKFIPEGNRTWTFCGTPEYVAPEIILNKGHDRAVDYWSLGVLMCELLIGTPPFTASDPMKIYNIILRGIDQIEFPRHVTKTAIALVKRFCRDNPAERLGYQKDGILDIKKHRWFQGFDWDGLEQRRLTPPIVPKIRSSSDASNFDKYPVEDDLPPDEISGWDIDF